MPASPSEDLRRAKVLLVAAFHGLRSYEFGNDSPFLAREVADEIQFQLDLWKREEGKK
jgi:hypothetical protein